MTQYEIGRFYRVPCVLTNGHAWLGSGWQPVIGPMHEDRGAVNFPHQHWHIDLRFLPKKNVHIGLHHLFGIPIMKEDRYGRAVVTAGPELRLKKYQRPMPSYPVEKAQWLGKLKAECAHMKLQNMICPHRGMPLAGCEQDGDEVQCPGHGLRWNVKTGELVR